VLREPAHERPSGDADVATASTTRSTEKRGNLPSTPSTLLTVLGFRPSVIARANRSMGSEVTSVTSTIDCLPNVDDVVYVI